MHKNIETLLKNGEADKVRVIINYNNGLWTAEARSANALGDTFPMFDPIRGEDALVGKGSTQQEALADLDAICGGGRSGYAAIRARGPFKVSDPNSAAATGKARWYRPVWVQDGSGNSLFLVSNEGEPTLAYYVVDAMNAARENRS